MPKDKPIRRGAFARGLSLTVAGARAGGAFALDGAVRRIWGDNTGNPARLEREAERFADRLGELKGSYVKIGQLFALLGEHFLPLPLTRALHRLEADTQPIQWRHMEPVFRAALGDHFAELTIEHEALAAASLAQVHRATVNETGESVVIKVQYPELAEVLDEDFQAVVRMLRLARWIPAGRDFDSWLSTLHNQLKAEIDYPRERVIAREMALALAGHPGLVDMGIELRIPAFFDDYCGPQCLTMAYVAGHRVGSEAVAALSQQQRDALGRLMLKLFFIEIFELGIMQTDPNFGNYLISGGGDSLTLLDFGSVVHLSASLRGALCDTIVAGCRRDEQAIYDALERLGCLNADAGSHAKTTFRTFVCNLLEPLAHPSELPREFLNSRGEYCWGRSGLIKRTGRHVTRSVTSRDFTIPSGDFAMVARKLTGVFTFISVLNAQFNAYDLVAPYLDKGLSAGEQGRADGRPGTRS